MTQASGEHFPHDTPAERNGNAGKATPEVAQVHQLTTPNHESSLGEETTPPVDAAEQNRELTIAGLTEKEIAWVNKEEREYHEPLYPTVHKPDALQLAYGRTVIVEPTPATQWREENLKAILTEYIRPEFQEEIKTEAEVLYAEKSGAEQEEGLGELKTKTLRIIKAIASPPLEWTVFTGEGDGQRASTTREENDLLGYEIFKQAKNGVDPSILYGHGGFHAVFLASLQSEERLAVNLAGKLGNGLLQPYRPLVQEVAARAVAAPPDKVGYLEFLRASLRDMQERGYSKWGERPEKITGLDDKARNLAKTALSYTHDSLQGIGSDSSMSSEVRRQALESATILGYQRKDLGTQIDLQLQALKPRQEEGLSEAARTYLQEQQEAYHRWEVDYKKAQGLRKAYLKVFKPQLDPRIPRAVLNNPLEGPRPEPYTPTIAAEDIVTATKTLRDTIVPRVLAQVLAVVPEGAPYLDRIHHIQYTGQLLADLSHGIAEMAEEHRTNTRGQSKGTLEPALDELRYPPPVHNQQIVAMYARAAIVAASVETGKALGEEKVKAARDAAEKDAPEPAMRQLGLAIER